MQLANLMLLQSTYSCFVDKRRRITFRSQVNFLPYGARTSSCAKVYRSSVLSSNPSISNKQCVIACSICTCSSHTSVFKRYAARLTPHLSVTAVIARPRHRIRCHPCRGRESPAWPAQSLASCYRIKTHTSGTAAFASGECLGAYHKQELVNEARSYG